MKSVELAPFACDPARSRGRLHPEVAAPTRTDFQRDRDRIVHSTAFRRLVYKTQVFLNHEGDLFRTRLTHSLEVAQLGRSIARALGINEDLVEAVSLAHDLGHTPFGHAGQDALNDCMGAFGGFEHNLQSLRVVDSLEERYPAYDGLNLTFETREGILKHCSLPNAQRLEQIEPGGVGSRFVHKRQPSLEAQLCNLADEIAYNAHDIDDGVRSGLLTLEQLDEVELFARYRAEATREHPHLLDAGMQRRCLHESIRRMLSAQVYDVMDSTRDALNEHKPLNVEEVRALPVLVRFSPLMREQSLELKRFLFRALYRHPQVMEMAGGAKQIVRDLFALYMSSPQEMKPAYALKAQQGDEKARAVTVSDFIAGMTDRYAIREHERLSGQRLMA